jgi:hypothetical protein
MLQVFKCQHIILLSNYWKLEKQIYGPWFSPYFSLKIQGCFFVHICKRLTLKRHHIYAKLFTDECD